MNSLNHNAFSQTADAPLQSTKATQADAVAGLSNLNWMTPLRTFQSIAAWIAANLSWSTLTGKPSTFAPSAHSHPTSEVTGLDTALAGKAAASHTHTASQITDFAAAVSAAAPPTTNASLLTSGTLPDARLSAGVATSLGKADSALQAAALTPYRTSAAQDTIDAGKQPAGSYATLVGGLVPSSQLPSYVDDVLEYATLAAFPATGETGKIYVATGTGKIYRWSGSAYVEIVAAPGSTDAVTEGSTNLYFTAARAVSALASTLASYATTTALNSAISGLASVYTTTAAVASQITAYGYQTASQVSSAISSALTSYATTASVSTALAAKLNLSESSYIIAKPGDDLAAKYTAAKALTPNGAAKSATNRAHLIIFPGNYTLTAELAIDAEFVDVIGLGAQTRTPAVLIAGNTLNVSANDVRVSGLSVGAQSFKITGDKPLQVFENCAGGASSFGGGALISTASGTFTDCSGGVDSFGSVGVASGLFANCRLTTGSFPTIYIPGKMRSCLDADYNVFDADGIYDPDASSFFTTASVTDNTAKLQLQAFVLGVKQLGLWSSMVCWPLRSTQNAGTGSTAYSLGGLGTYNGTLINGPTWGADGVTFASASSQQINVSLESPSPITDKSIIAIFNPTTADQWTGIAGFMPTTAYTDVSIARNSTGKFGLALAGGGGNGAVATQTAPTATSTYLHGYHSGRNVTVVKNGTSTTTGTFAVDPRAATSFRIGTVETGFAFNGLVSFAAMISGSSAGTQSAAIYALYKSTLGQGLGLP
jgi:hypothetical protein